MPLRALVKARNAGLLLVLVIAACTTRPFEVESPAPAGGKATAASVSTAVRGPHEYDPNPRPIALCYSSQLNTQQEVLARARELCPNGGAISFFQEDAFFNDCSLFQPFRVTFICTPGPAPVSPYN